MDLVKIYFELIRPVDMPWQVAVFIFTVTLVVYWIIRIGQGLIILFGKIGTKLTEWIVRLLLLPEFLFTSLFRWIKVGSAPGADTYDDFIVSIGSFLHEFFNKASTFRGRNIKFPMRWVMLLMIFVIVVWYMREFPDYRNTTFSEYVDRGFSLYYKLQSRILSR